MSSGVCSSIGPVGGSAESRFLGELYGVVSLFLFGGLRLVFFTSVFIVAERPMPTVERDYP